MPEEQEPKQTNRFALKVEIQQETGLGLLKYDDVVAIIETNLPDPATVGRMLAYGHVRVCRLAEGEWVECVGERIEPPPEDEVDEEEGPVDEEEEGVEVDVDVDVDVDIDHPLNVLSQHGADDATIKAVKDAGIQNIEQLSEKIVAGEKIPQVGELRVKQLTSALDALEKSES